MSKKKNIFDLIVMVNLLCESSKKFHKDKETFSSTCEQRKIRSQGLQSGKWAATRYATTDFYFNINLNIYREVMSSNKSKFCPSAVEFDVQSVEKLQRTFHRFPRQQSHPIQKAGECVK